MITSKMMFDDQYPERDMPERSCWCFKASSRSLRMNYTMTQGIRERAMATMNTKS